MNFFYVHKVNKLGDNFSTIFSRNKVVHIIPDFNEGIEELFKKLASQAGTSLIYEEDPETGFIDVTKWTEIKYEPEKSLNTYKSSNKYQPLHTDYGYFSFEIFAAFFYCVEQAKFGGATTFIDVDKVVEVLEQVNPNLLSHLQKTQIHFGRKDNPIAHNNDYILQKDNLGWKINWNYYRALGDYENKILIEDFKDFLDNYIEKSGELTELKLQKGEGVFFQDRRVLHGRNSFLGNRQLNKGAITKVLPEEVVQLISLP